MKKFFLVVLGMLTAAGAYAAISTSQIYELNHMNRVAYKHSLGTLIQNAETPGTSVITSTMISDGTIGSSDIGNDEIWNKNIAVGAVTTTEISDGTIGSSDIGSGEVWNATLAANAVTTDKITDGTILEADLDGYDSDNARLVQRVVRAVWDPSGTPSQGSSTTDSGLHSLGVSIPANSILTRSYMYTVTQPTDAGNEADAATLAFQCEDANNIFTATDVSGYEAGTIYEGAQTGASSVMVNAISADCNVSAQIAADDYDAGKIILFVEYVIAE